MAKAGFHKEIADSYAILMSDSVFDEITGKGLAGSDEYKQLLLDKKLSICPVLNKKTTDSRLQKLDRGERDILRLFHKGLGDFVVTDDGAAAKYCLNKNIPFVNSLLLLRLLHHSTIINDNDYKTGFYSLLNLGRYSNKVKAFAKSCPENELLFFLP